MRRTVSVAACVMLAVGTLASYTGGRTKVESLARSQPIDAVRMSGVIRVASVQNPPVLSFQITDTSGGHHLSGSLEERDRGTIIGFWSRLDKGRLTAGITNEREEVLWSYVQEPGSDRPAIAIGGAPLVTDVYAEAFDQAARRVAGTPHARLIADLAMRLSREVSQPELKPQRRALALAYQVVQHAFPDDQRPIVTKTATTGDFMLLPSRRAAPAADGGETDAHGPVAQGPATPPPGAPGAEDTPKFGIFVVRGQPTGLRLRNNLFEGEAPARTSMPSPLGPKPATACPRALESAFPSFGLDRIAAEMMASESPGARTISASFKALTAPPLPPARPGSAMFTRTAGQWSCSPEIGVINWGSFEPNNSRVGDCYGHCGESCSSNFAVCGRSQWVTEIVSEQRPAGGGGEGWICCGPYETWAAYDYWEIDVVHTFYGTCGDECRAHDACCREIPCWLCPPPPSPPGCEGGAHDCTWSYTDTVRGRRYYEVIEQSCRTCGDPCRTRQECQCNDNIASKQAPAGSAPETASTPKP